MRIFCAQFPHLGLVAALRCFPELRGEPVIVGGAPELRLPVIAASPAAWAGGVRPGQALRQAQQLCPAAAFVPFDQAAAAGVQETIRTSLQRLTPEVEVGVDEAFCDISGRHAVHSDEASWAAAIARALDASLQTGPPAAGVGGSRLVAHLAAQHSQPGRIRRVKAGDEAAFLAPLPLTALPVDTPVRARLAAFGLDCLGAVAALSPADLQRQFGSAGLRVHQLARGQDGEGVHAAPALRAWQERMVLEAPVGDLEVLLRAARHCAETLGERLRGAALSAAVVAVRYELDGAAPLWERDEAISPLGNRAETWTAALGLLGRLQPARPVTAVTVEVSSLRPARARQADMWRTGDAARNTVALTAERLRARYGATAVQRPALALDPGDLPERRYTWGAPGLAGARA